MSTIEYLENQVLTASPYQLHLMVIDGAIRFAKQGRIALAEKDFEMSHLALNQSRDFMNELIGGLKDEHNPELIDQLKGLFVFVIRNLAEADFEHEAQKVDDAILVLEAHRATWLELADKIPAASAPQSASMPTANDDDIVRKDESHDWTM